MSEAVTLLIMARGVARGGPPGAGCAVLPWAQKAIAVCPIRAYGAVGGGRGAVGAAGARNVGGRGGWGVVDIVRTDGRRARAARHVGAVVRARGVAVDGAAAIFVNVIPLRDRKGDEGVRDRNSVQREIEETGKETETKAQTKTEVGWKKNEITGARSNGRKGKRKRWIEIGKPKKGEMHITLRERKKGKQEDRQLQMMHCSWKTHSSPP